jgi:signal transduction histidine kinase
LIGGVVLVLGLLLVLAAVFATRIPGGAMRAQPGIVRFLLSPIHPATWYANGAILVGFVTGGALGGIVIAIASTAASTLLGGIGFVFAGLAIEGSRFLARVERRRVFLGATTVPQAHHYRELRGGVADVLRALFLDESRWRDLLYAAINVPLAAVQLLVAVLVWTLCLSLLTVPGWYPAIEGVRFPGASIPVPALGADVEWLLAAIGLVLLPVAASLSQLIVTLQRGLVAVLICTSESRALRRQVETLRQSREAVLDTEASELHRIERDLHDGAQQRLVALTIDLGLAGEKVESDPAAARALIVDGQEQARQALAEIRALVRGIAPSILLDRGLRAALESVAGRGPVPTSVVGELRSGDRLPAAVERAAYFVASEALANVARHSGAKGCEVRLDRVGPPEARRLVVEVWDDGRGGARALPDRGLEGLQRRVAGVDGVLTVTSPAGGPTSIRAEIPIPAVPAAGPPPA